MNREKLPNDDEFCPFRWEFGGVVDLDLFLAETVKTGCVYFRNVSNAAEEVFLFIGIGIGIGIGIEIESFDNDPDNDNDLDSKSFKSNN